MRRSRFPFEDLLAAALVIFVAVVCTMMLATPLSTRGVSPTTFVRSTEKAIPEKADRSRRIYEHFADREANLSSDAQVCACQG
jgi:hypothetical protein